MASFDEQPCPIVYPGDPIDETDVIPFPVKIPNPVTPGTDKDYPYFPMGTSDSSDNYLSSAYSQKPLDKAPFLSLQALIYSALLRGTLSAIWSAAFSLAGRATPPPSDANTLHFALCPLASSAHSCNKIHSSEMKSPSAAAATVSKSDEPTDSVGKSRSDSFVDLLSAYKLPQNSENDAGNKPSDHYKSRLSPWRYNLRESLLPLIRWETPRLAKLQEKVRSPGLDFFFIMTANFGSHTFYVTMIPILFWLGLTAPGRDLVFVLSFGVFLTGFFKDLLCLPRPLSPPLHRLTMSGSAALEYGFPSTHTTNAVSASLIWFSFMLTHKDWFFTNNHSIMYYFLHSMNAVYISSMIFGRIYCGMHGFLDIIGGSIIGVALWVVRHVYGPIMDYYLLESPHAGRWVAGLIIVTLLLIRVHPEPIDDCPCFDDGVAFIAVLAGSYLGQWHFGTKLIYKQMHDPSNLCFACIPYNTTDGYIFLKTILRLVIGIAMLSIWRPTMKRALHEALPPIFRFVEKVGLSMPRRFFIPASQYTDIPSAVNEQDAALFSTENIASLVRRIKSRSDSVGPQSAADVYESLAYREYQKEKAKQTDSSGISYRGSKSGTSEKESSAISSAQNDSTNTTSTITEGDNNVDYDISQVVTPRVKYDVEVITKFVVYSGISVIVCDICGVLFATMGI